MWYQRINNSRKKFRLSCCNWNVSAPASVFQCDMCLFIGLNILIDDSIAVESKELNMYIPHITSNAKNAENKTWCMQEFLLVKNQFKFDSALLRLTYVKKDLVYVCNAHLYICIMYMKSQQIRVGNKMYLKIKWKS